MQDRPAYAISPSRFPFPVFTPLIKPSSGRCVEPTTVHPYLYRDPASYTTQHARKLDREAVQGGSTGTHFSVAKRRWMMCLGNS